MLARVLRLMTMATMVLAASGTALPEAAADPAPAAPEPLPGLQKVALPPVIVFRGTYVCAQGLTVLELLVVEDEAIFHFSAAPSNPHVPSGWYSMRGTVDLARGLLRLMPERWMNRPGESWSMVGLDGVSRDGGRSFQGEVAGPGCTTFSLSRSL